mgnify:CR=1 FL=1
MRAIRRGGHQGAARDVVRREMPEEVGALERIDRPGRAREGTPERLAGPGGAHDHLRVFDEVLGGQLHFQQLCRNW